MSPYPPTFVLVWKLFTTGRPTWWTQTSTGQATARCVIILFITTNGIIYDVIVEPPSVGSTTDEHGHSRPVAFMAYRVNGQYIMEGLASSFMFALGGIGFIVLDQTHSPSTPKLNRILLIIIGFSCIIIASIACYAFMKIKLPDC
ncbi:unnamed protein product, partial [Meganyctiphanes norvegica]